jgi:hypothetical protein
MKKLKAASYQLPAHREDGLPFKAGSWRLEAGGWKLAAGSW